MIHPRSICGVLVSSALLAFLSSRTCAADEIEVLRWVPPTCNAVALVELRALLNSPLGQHHKWLAEVRQAYAQGELSAPPFVQRIVQGTMFDAAGGPKHVTYSIYSTDQDSVIHDVASHELAKTEKIAGHLAVDSLRNVYFVQLAPGVVGAVKPADRLAVSRWVRAESGAGAAQIAPPLKAALESTAGRRSSFAST